MSKTTIRMGQMPQKRKPRWTPDEKRILRHNIQKGAKWVARKLGRSEKSVRRQAERMNLSFKEPGRLTDLCPECGVNRIVKGSHAARFGICTTCYFREETRRFQQLAEERKARAAKEAARQEYYRAPMVREVHEDPRERREVSANAEAKSRQENEPRTVQESLLRSRLPTEQAGGS